MTEGINPYGNLSATGDQWSEARGFLRVFGKNPYAQLRLVQVLAGLHKNTAEGWRPNPSSTGGVRNEAAAEAITVVLRYIREQLPEWASTERVALDSDFGLPDYPGCDPNIKQYIEDVLLEGEFDKGGVE